VTSRLAAVRLGRRRVATAAVLLAVSGGLTPCYAQAADASRILVMPFENVKRDGTIFWLGEASSLLLADDLNAVGVSAITRQERQQAFERLQVPPSAVLTDATVIRIAQLVGAAQVIVGSLQRDADGLVVRARTLALDAGRVQADVTERGPIPDAGAPILLSRYAQRRVEPVLAMHVVTDGLARLFGPPSPWLSAVRNAGMAAVDRLPFLKRALAQPALR